MKKFPNVLYVKSGTDFQNLSEIVVRKQKDGQKIEEGPLKMEYFEVVTEKAYHYNFKDGLTVTLTKHDITKDVPPNEKVLKHVEKYDVKLQETMKNVLPIDQIFFKVLPEVNLKFSNIRTTESSLGNIVADIVRKDATADCCLISAGSLRADTIYPPGKHYTYGDMFDIYPLEKYLCLIEIDGESIYKGLECGVSKYPGLEGRFPQVSDC